MEQFCEILSESPLFSGISRSEMREMLGCLRGKVVDISKGSPIFLEGDPARYVGVVLSGTVQIVREDYYGNRSVLTAVGPGGLFGEAFACAGLEALPVSAIASAPAAVLLLECGRILTSCGKACHFHSRLTENLLRVIAQKNLALTAKIHCMSRKTTREKLMEYLLEQAKRHASPEFVIPFDRQTLADYLGVERSAMSTELGKLRRAGLIEFHGSRFRLLKP